MSMISELVDRLRVESKSMGKYGVDYMSTLLMDASDTIVMLSEKARAARPNGKWIDMNGATVFPFWQRYKCSVCGERADMSNYCPRCGSRMKGENDD